VFVFVFAEKEDTGKRGNMMARQLATATKAIMIVLSFLKEGSNESRRDTAVSILAKRRDQTIINSPVF
jgi:hypothetical protein